MDTNQITLIIAGITGIITALGILAVNITTLINTLKNGKTAARIEEQTNGHLSEIKDQLAKATFRPAGHSRATDPQPMITIPPPAVPAQSAAPPK